MPLEPAPAMVGVCGGGGGEEDRDFADVESLGDWEAEKMRRSGGESKDPLPSYRQ